jgi:hypothetical protein
VALWKLLVAAVGNLPQAFAAKELTQKTTRIIKYSLKEAISQN